MPITDADQLTPLEDLINQGTTEANNYTDTQLAVLHAHHFRIQSSAEALSNNTQTKLSTFGTVVDSAVNVVYSAGDWTVSEDGVYSIVGQAGFASNSTGDRRAYIYKGGSQISRSAVNADATTGTTVPVSAQLHLNSGDTVSLRALQSSGGSLNTDPSNTQLSVTWLRP